MSWYAMQVLTGREDDVVAMLHRAGIHATAPVRAALERRGGQWEPVRKALLPGYVLIECEMTVQLYYHLGRKPAVVRLLGGAGEVASPIPPEQMRSIGAMMLHYDWDLQAGISRGRRGTNGTVEILDGPLTLVDRSKILKVDARRRRATVELTLYGDTYQTDMALIVEDGQATGDGPEADTQETDGTDDTEDKQP